MAWQVDFFVDERGQAPVEEYLTNLPMQHRAKLLALIKMLEHKRDRTCRFLTPRRFGEN
jgi:hypothetical protein